MHQANQNASTYVGVPIHTEPPTTKNQNSESKSNPRFYNSHDEKSPHFKSKLERLNILSRLNFLYVFQIISKCWKADKGGPALHDKDLVTFPYNDRGEMMEQKFMEQIQKQKQKNPKKGVNSALAVAMTIKWTFLKVVLLQISFGFMRVFVGWVIKRLIDCYMDPDQAHTHAYWWAGILAGILLFSFYFEHHWYHMVIYQCATIRSGLISMLYSKITRLSVNSITKISAGKLVNIAANDVNVFEIYGTYFPSVVSAWFILIAAAALLWIYFGVTCLLGIGYLVALTPIQATIALLSVKPREEKNVASDERVRKTSEAIEGIRLLKMYTWELKFQEIIDKLRKTDIKMMKKVLYLGDVVSRSLSWSSQYVACFLMFMLYYVTGGDLTISKAFSTYFVLTFIRIYFSYFVANGFNFAAETRLLFKRIDEIMETPEMGDKLFEDPINSENSIEFDKFTAYWNMNDSGVNPVSNIANPLNQAYELQTSDHLALKSTLTDINLNIKKGSLNAVVGPVGASKTSFLLSFTGEMPKTTGQLRYKGKIAYVEQEPTIFAGTFRESILFGKDYDEEFYHKVIKACNLENDLKLFPNGDMSAIGERGNNLSGGQKARLALARAVYADADIYLLDDPISAVDAKVAKSIWNETILGLLKDKTVILVTHQVHFVRDIENIIVMEGGKVLGKGTYEQLEAKGIDVGKIFSAEVIKEDEEEEEQKPTANSQEKLSEQQQQQKQENDAKHEAEILANKMKENNIIIKANHEENHANDITTDAPITFTSNDDPHAGKVDLRTYALLFKEVGFRYMFFIFISYVLVQFGDVAFGRTLGAWVAGEFTLGESLGVVGALSIYMLVLHYLKDSAYTFGFLGAARRYHKRMLTKILRSPVGFFDANPVGRILNRFSNDIGVLDKFVPHVALDVFDILALVLTVFITLAILDPVLLGPICLSIVVVALLIIFFYPAIKQTKSYELGTKGPLFSLFSSSISGIVIIRTYGQEGHFKQKFTSSLYKFTKGNVNFVLASRFLGFCIDMFYYLTAIGMFYITTARLNPADGPSGGVLAAFTLVLIMSLTGLFQHGVRQFCQTNVLMTAAARVQAYCDLPEEAPVDLPKDQEYTTQGWPKKADIEFNKVYMKYKADGDFVIKNLNLIANDGQKIGCVGRTGAGKSTIINLLFRLQEIFKNEDTSDSYITVDKINTETMGLHLLRGNISIIPQIPFIFTGTVRQNIDPLNEFTDQQIWDVLQEVRLKDHVSKLPEKLETRMNNASAIFSVGQKQLVCLARTILKPRKVLVLDEATANMDSETDNFIQQKVMEKFKNSTVFTIAHRLATIADYDKVLVLDKGQKAEFDAPYKLLVKSIGDATLTNPLGHFGSMVTNTGPLASQRIVNIAKRAYERKTKKGNL